MTDQQPARTGSARARAGDADRERTSALLGDAAGAGYLRLDELDERLDRALAARTTGELDALVADLPASLRQERERRERALRERASAQACLRPQVRAYAAVMALLVGIWLAVGLSAGAWYPWPVWPALGWGIGIAGHARRAYGRPALG
ncbi:DUF1707 domain-containing protein [Vallicoccus soli]|uniref:DUF1707 domain-containing protein n=1 Tax=Vallicoccus soli TaxID=2339232 RepID=A0A3A3Z4F7_9ACTN|nr:DUF1707 domain-containing protein [Vallicoccus soli]RJK97818.1 DUF1707 domain-containing protein [Vallicoccus soli]